MNQNQDFSDAMFLVNADDETGAYMRTLSFSRSPTVLLTFAANGFTRDAAKIYKELYGIGAMDWRMLVMLTRQPGVTVTQSANTIGIDKGAVSRSVARLEKKELAVRGELHSNGRSRGWWLTDSGRHLHSRVLDEALARQRVLLKGYSKDEIVQFCDLLSRFIQNLNTLAGRE